MARRAVVRSRYAALSPQTHGAARRRAGMLREQRDRVTVLGLGGSGQRPCHVVLLIQDAPCPSSRSRGVRKRIVQRTGDVARAPADKRWLLPVSLR